jgi:hypothetical protein
MLMGKPTEHDFWDLARDLKPGELQRFLREEVRYAIDQGETAATWCALLLAAADRLDELEGRR